jgi:hypothetical protein
MKKTLALCVILAGAALAPATAQEIYRCGDSYSHKPCPGGTRVQADDPRSASQRSQTSQAAQRDGKAADAMEKARLKEEAKPVPGFIPAPKDEAPEPEQAAPGKPKKPAHFTAIAPRKPGEAARKKKAKKKKEV